MNPSDDLDKAHHWFAVECNNLAWDLFERPSRTPDEDAQMLHAAHASCFHWMHVGNALNEQRAMCLLTFAHSALGSCALALRYAVRCLELSQLDGLETTPFDLAAAYAGNARAYACSGDAKKAKEFRALAMSAAKDISDEEDRTHFLAILM
ncbi:MAG: hypothetical protein WC655_08185 [Candidatus Hydrogenedentales bacterium]|jgi:hypothetical protein